MTDPRMTTNDGPVTVEQCDREAAFRLWKWQGSLRSNDGRVTRYRDLLDRGEKDTSGIVQAFARHRLAALASAPAGDGLRPVPQAWIDRAMQIEAAADGLVSMVNDAIQRAKEGTGRLYAANIGQLDKWAEQVLEAINLPEPVFPPALARPHSAIAPAGDGVEAATQMMRDCASHLTSTASHHGQYAAIDQDKIDGLRDAVRDFDALQSPRAVGEQSREWWVLEWIGAPRPPVHPNPMTGRRSFPTAEAALAFWNKQPADATYGSLTKHTETIVLQSPPAKVEK